jgi:hypothetical protein
VLGAITYGLAQTQPAENRGKWQSMAMGMVVGGIIVADILIHPAGTQAATNGLASIATPAESSLLGGGK